VVIAVRVVVADDDLLLREGLASLLDRSGFDVVGQAGDGAQLLALVREKTPELVVADIRMPPTHTTEGLDAARLIRDEFPDIAILVLSAHVEVEHAMELLASGRSIGYLLKSRVTDVADSWTRSSGSRRARRWSIQRWCLSWCRRGGTMIRWRPSVHGSARCWS
jgi:DNA-binding NarL/FixJ family response regulator